MKSNLKETGIAAVSNNKNVQKEKSQISFKAEAELVDRSETSN